MMKRGTQPVGVDIWVPSWGDGHRCLPRSSAITVPDRDVCLRGEAYWNNISLFPRHHPNRQCSALLSNFFLCGLKHSIVFSTTDVSLHCIHCEMRSIVHALGIASSWCLGISLASSYSSLLWKSSNIFLEKADESVWCLRKGLCGAPVCVWSAVLDEKHKSRCKIWRDFVEFLGASLQCP